MKKIAISVLMTGCFYVAQAQVDTTQKLNKMPTPKKADGLYPNSTTPNTTPTYTTGTSPTPTYPNTPDGTTQPGSTEPNTYPNGTNQPTTPTIPTTPPTPTTPPYDKKEGKSSSNKSLIKENDL